MPKLVWFVDVTSGAARVVALMGATFALTACPPSGAPPAFEADAAPPDPADTMPDPPDTAIAVGCLDGDGDGFVVDRNCGIPSGDCDPEDDRRFPGSPERCNGLDDDCDGRVDEEDPGGGDACEAEAEGVCRRGSTTCREGAIACLPGRADEEVCNGADDDCDGEIDEADPALGRACETGGYGICGPGAVVCIAGALGCEALQVEEPEICNGLDDDCDGEEDEGSPGAGGGCDTDRPGICADGEQRCQGGNLICVVQRLPEAELCNGLDDDCDGRVDETWTGRLGTPCESGLGACVRPGRFICGPEGVELVCDAVVGEPVAERCNEIDDDCDGAVDEQLGLGEACEVGVGECARVGERVCGPDSTVICGAEPGEPGEEICNALDDDCDGQIDETFDTLGAPCEVRLSMPGGDPAIACPTTGTWICDRATGGVTCDAEPVAPAVEICNDFDDDCDGVVDNGFPERGVLCAIGEGACRSEGVRVCNPAGDGLVCDALVIPPAAAEACNGVDDDCDGRIDNGAVCEHPPTGLITELRILAPSDAAAARCPDRDGDGAPDLGLAPTAATFNDAIAASLATRSRIILLRARDVADLEGRFRVDVLSGRPTDDAGVAVASGALDAIGRARHVLEPVEIADGRIAMPAPDAAVAMPSPFFHAAHAPWLDWGVLRLTVATLDGDGALEGGGFRIDDGRLAGWVAPAAVLDDYRAAAAACAEVGVGAPVGCAVFAATPPEALADLLVPDVDTDGDAVPDAISACFALRAIPAPNAEMPPRGGQPCARDDDCLAGLVCRPVPVVADPVTGGQLAPRCGVPGAGDRPNGLSCEIDDDCRYGVCARYTAGIGRCSGLCGDDAPCPDDLACRGVRYEVEGARDAAAASARLCLPVSGSGRACEVDACPDGELCSVWLEGDVGVPGGEIEGRGYCGAPAIGAARTGSECRSPFDCERGNGCVPDADGALWCAAPCRTTADCGAGEQCRVGAVGDPRSEAAGLGLDGDALYGYCLPRSPELGSAVPCDGDLECPAGETCRASYLPGIGTVDRLCVTGEGFFAVGQPCAVDADCASNACVGGFCGGLCGGDADCGPFLACADDAVFDAEHRVVLGGACATPSSPCGRDDDCNRDPLCERAPCVCGFDGCRIGCNANGGMCPQGQVCTATGLCQPYCRDDLDEPNDVADDAYEIALDHAAPRFVDRRRLCAVSPVDWLAIDHGGLPVRVRIAPAAGDEGVAIAADLFGDDGELLVDGVPDPEVVGGVSVTFDDRDAVAARAGRPVWLRVRATRVRAGVDYTLDVERLTPNCPDPHPEPRDAPWQWTRLLAESGAFADETADGWICPGDTDWYAIYLGNGDRLTLDYGTVDAGAELPGRLIVDLLGPDYPQFFDRQIARIPAEEATGSIEFEPPAKLCDFTAHEQPQFGLCRYEGVRLADELCDRAEDCVGGTYYLRIRGEGPFDLARYRIDASVERATIPGCVPDPFEPDDVPSFTERVYGGVPPGISARPQNVGPGILPDVDYVSRGHVLCVPGDVDSITFVYQPGERVFAELRQTGEFTRPVGMQIIDETEGRQLLATREDISPRIRLEADASELRAFSIISVAVGLNGQGAGAAPYDLLIRRESSTYVADPACDDVERLVMDPIRRQLELDSTTAGAADDQRPVECFGGKGPDRVYFVELPGPGRVTAVVDATGNDGYDPSVSLRIDCETDASEVACNEDDLDHIDPRTRAAAIGPVGGRGVWVVVDSFAEDTAGAFHLTVRWTPL